MTYSPANTIWVLLGAALVVFMQVWSMVAPRQGGAWVQQDVGAVSLTPWRWAVPVGIALLIVVVLNYAAFADFSVWFGK